MNEIKQRPVWIKAFEFLAAKDTDWQPVSDEDYHDATTSYAYPRKYSVSGIVARIG